MKNIIHLPEANDFWKINKEILEKINCHSKSHGTVSLIDFGNNLQCIEFLNKKLR